MHRWFNSRAWLFILVFFFLAFLSGLLLNNSNSQYSKDNAPVSASTEKIIPTRIKIPILGIDSDIKPVGLTKQKVMVSPEGPNEVVWYKLGASPGEMGSSVIAGHRGWKIGPAIFDDLHKLKIGDKVHVDDEKGNTLSFVVREMRTYDADERVPEVWNKNDSAYLNLITCSGNWNVLTGTSEKRLVVFTELVK